VYRSRLAGSLADSGDEEAARALAELDALGVREETISAQ